MFSDFVEILAITISNGCNPIHRAEREKTYLAIIKQYEKKEQDLLVEAFAILVNDMEKNFHNGRLVDILGVLFHELELHSKWVGQFFTPQHIGELMNRITFDDSNLDILKEKHMTLLEPACGSGVFILDFANLIKEKGYDFRTKLVVTAVDIDLKCVYMTYIQLALNGIPAVVIHGNSLTLEEWSRWYTPTYIFDNWVWKQPCGFTTKRNKDDEMLKMFSEPMYAAFRQIFGYGNNIISSLPDDSAVEKQEDTTDKVEKSAFDYTIRKNGQLSLFN